MRKILILASACLAGGLILTAAPRSTTAAPAPSVLSLDTPSNAVETVGYRRRYYRHYGVWPPGPPPDGWRRYYRRYGVLPPPVVLDDDVLLDDDVIIDDDDDVIIDDDDVVVVPVPVRPSSCGEYHYWNGVACVDARYNDPYLGRK